jgi:hypothetical protein
MLNQRLFENIRDLELRVLRALCAGAVSGRDQLLAELATYSWIEAEHRIVYEALSNTPLNDARALREQLPSQATRMGFPDVNWDLFSDGSAMALADLQGLVRQLKRDRA